MAYTMTDLKADCPEQFTRDTRRRIRNRLREIIEMQRDDPAEASRWLDTLVGTFGAVKVREMATQLNTETEV